MNMKKILIANVMFACLFSACTTQDKDAELVGKWQAVDMEAPDVDRARQEQMNFLDTMGDHTTPEQNMEIYGVADVTNLKDSLKEILMNYPKVQAEMLANSSVEFGADSTFISVLNGHADTGKWYINEAGGLIISDDVEQAEVKLLSLTDTSLKLEMQREGLASTLIFSRVAN